MTGAEWRTPTETAGTTKPGRIRPLSGIPNNNGADGPWIGRLLNADEIRAVFPRWRKAITSININHITRSFDGSLNRSKTFAPSFGCCCFACSARAGGGLLSATNDASICIQIAVLCCNSSDRRLFLSLLTSSLFKRSANAFSLNVIVDVRRCLRRREMFFLISRILRDLAASRFNNA